MDPGSHVEFQISTKNAYLVDEHFWQVWFKSVQWFQRRRFKCKKLTDGCRTPSHDKSSHGLWPGELKITNQENFIILALI
jgi:hypothetical protein